MSPAVRPHRGVLPALLLGMFLASQAAAQVRAVPYGPTPVIDGIAGPWSEEWDHSLLLWTPHTDPFEPHWLVARIQRDDSRLYLCALTSGAWDYSLPARVDVRIRTLSGSGPVPASGDFALRILAQTGLTQSAVGDGVGFTTTGRPFDWLGARALGAGCSFEWSIPLDLLPEPFQLAVFHMDYDVPGPGFSFPSADVTERPLEWGTFSKLSANLGAPPAPVALALRSRAAPGGRIDVDLSSPVDGELASFDVTGRCTERVAVQANAARSLRLGESRPLAAGVHFVRLRAGAEQRVQRVVVLP